MVGVAGLKIWVMTLVEYDTFGNGKVVLSYVKPANDSAIKGKEKFKKKTKEIKTQDFGEQSLF